MNSSILFNKDAYSHLQEAIDLICNAVKTTLGPRGKNVLIINGYGDAHLTKDGITVAKNVTHNDPIINGILNVVREASANTAKNAGDGTTSTLVLTQAIFTEGLKFIRNGYNPTLIKAGMQKALEDILCYVERNSEKITIKDTARLSEIAKISANMDESVSQVALQAINETQGVGVVRIDSSKSSITSIKCDSGLTFKNGYISPHFLTSENTVIEYENPLIFVSSVELSNKTLVDLLKFARDNTRPIIILAPEFNENIFMSMFKNFKSGAIQVCPIKLPGFAGNRAQWIDDITAYIDGEVFSNNNINPIKFVGEAERITISAEETSIVNETIKETCVSQINKLKTRLLDDIEDYERESLTNRIANLQGKVVTIFVGATTELELKEKKDRIEDAVCALQTALKGGISEGGGMTFIRCSNELFTSDDETPESKGYNAVLDALFKPFEQLCINSDLDYTEILPQSQNNELLGFNFKTLEWQNLKENGVIDPTLVLKNAITNAVGIASNLLMTECITHHD